MKNNIKIGITIGDANGIGPEIIIKTFLEYKEIEYHINYNLFYRNHTILY